MAILLSLRTPLKLQCRSISCRELPAFPNISDKLDGCFLLEVVPKGIVQSKTLSGDPSPPTQRT